jgi:hypothetical protein
MRILLTAALFAAMVPAQTFTEPPLLIRVARGQTPPQYQQAQAKINVFAMNALTGPHDTWRIELHNSFESIEGTVEALRRFVDPQTAPSGDIVSNELLGDTRSLIAVFRPGLSYRPDQAIRMFGKSRYFYATIHRIRTGTGAEFSELLRSRREGLDDINLDRPDLAYQVIAGASTGTYLILAPLTSLKTLDDGLAKRAYQADPGATGPKAAAKVADIELGRLHMLFRIEPSLSYVSDELAGESPEFWRGR